MAKRVFWIVLDSAGIGGAPDAAEFGDKGADTFGTCYKSGKLKVPFMEKMVERFKDNDKVQFISISVDENVDAWKNMIEADKPAWPQYNVTKETAKKFMSDWGITGIPRFIMIDKNGNIFSADSSRPSEEKTAQIIEEQTK